MINPDTLGIILGGLLGGVITIGSLEFVKHLFGWKCAVALALTIMVGGSCILSQMV